MRRCREIQPFYLHNATHLSACIKCTISNHHPRPSQPLPLPLPSPALTNCLLPHLHSSYALDACLQFHRRTIAPTNHKTLHRTPLASTPGRYGRPRHDRPSHLNPPNPPHTNAPSNSLYSSIS